MKWYKNQRCRLFERRISTACILDELKFIKITQNFDKMNVTNLKATMNLHIKTNSYMRFDTHIPKLANPHKASHKWMRIADLSWKPIYVSRYIIYGMNRPFGGQTNEQKKVPAISIKLKGTTLPWRLEPKSFVRISVQWDPCVEWKNSRFSIREDTRNMRRAT